MADDGSLNRIDHVLGDVGGEVTNTFQLARHGELMDELFNPFGVSPNLLLDEHVHLSIELIDFLVRRTDLPCQHLILPHESIQALTHHRLRLCTITSRSRGRVASGYMVRYSARRAMFTAWSAMRSRSLLILSTATTKRKSIATGW